MIYECETRGRPLCMVRSDTFNIAYYVEEGENNLFEFEDGDVLFFTVKNNAYTEEIIIQKQITDFEYDNTMAFIQIVHEDTKDLKYGKYVYDIQLLRGDDRYTFTSMGDFIISKEVTFE